MKIIELYQEPKGGSFTHDKIKYNINIILKLVDKDPISYFKIADLKWILSEDDAVRIKKADLNAPLLMTIWNHKWVILDGVHRLQKAINEKVDLLPGKIVSLAQLSKAELA